MTYMNYIQNFLNVSIALKRVPEIMEEIVVRIIFMIINLIADSIQIILKKFSKYSRIPLITICQHRSICS